MADPLQDLTGITLKVLFIGGLLVACFLIMQPFLPAIVWAITLVIATWPLMLWVERRAGNRRSVAVVVMTLAVLLVLIVPFGLAIATVVDNADQIGELVRTVLSLRVPPPPDWLAGIPLLGPPAAEAWGTLTSAGVQELAPRLTPYAGALTQWFASTAGSVGTMFVHFLLTTLIAAVLYAGGERAAAMAIRFGRRMAGDRGELAVRQTGQAVRAVALGVVVTAVAQTIVGGVGLAVVGLPFAGVMTALMLVLCLVQLGPGWILVPAVVWMYYSGEVVWGSVLLVFTILAVTIDQFIRPILIRRGADLPLLLILAGVIGGLIAFGILGVFLGPTVLAVAYTLLNAWMADGAEPKPALVEVPATEPKLLKPKAPARAKSR